MFWLGWTVLLISTFLINHFELFGLRQVVARLRGRALPRAGVHDAAASTATCGTRSISASCSRSGRRPRMTAGHLLFAIATTGYILIGIYFEERDLIAQFGDRYRVYRQQVGMLLPRSSNARRGPAGQ